MTRSTNQTQFSNPYEDRRSQPDYAPRNAYGANSTYGSQAAGAYRFQATETQVSQPRYQPQQQEKSDNKPWLFSNISVVQVIATALAALTSMMFSAQIGVAGSIIGVVAASVVSTVSAQIYKNILSRPAKKIKENIQSEQPEQGGYQDQFGQSVNRSGFQGEPGGYVSQQPLGAHVANATNGLDGQGAYGARSTYGSQALHNPQAQSMPMRGQQDWRSSQSVSDYSRNSSAAVAAESSKLSRRRTLAKIILVTLISGIAAVAISYGAIQVLTAGNGIGEKVVTIPTVVQTTESSSSDSTDNGAADSQNSENQNATVSGSQATGTQSESTGTSGSTSGSQSGQESSSASSSSTESGGSSSGPSSSGGSSSGTQGGGTSGTGGSSGTSSGSGSGTSGTGSSSSGTSAGSASSTAQ